MVSDLRGVPSRFSGGAISDAEDVEHHGEDAARRDDGNDAGDDGRGRGLADGGGAVAALHAAQAAGKGDQDAVHGALEDPAHKVRQVDGFEVSW